MLGELEKIESGLRRYGAEEKALRERLIGSIARLVVSEDSEERLGEIEEVLAGFPRIEEGTEDKPSAEALEAARARNLVRVLKDRGRLRRECVASSEIREALGVGRERLRQLREAGRLVGISGGARRPTLYPYWQFGPDGTMLPGLEEVVRASREAGMGPETLHFFMTEPNERLSGARPAELLRRGEASSVARVLRSSGLGSF